MPAAVPFAENAVRNADGQGHAARFNAQSTCAVIVTYGPDPALLQQLQNARIRD